MQFINIHTHNIKSEGFSVINLFPENRSEIEQDKFYSVGIHPWEVSKIDPDKQLALVSEMIIKENVIAVGEIGLDKLHDDFNLQKDLFLKQLNIAKENNKPVIIHCVKVFSELLEILKKEKRVVPVIIHRYSGNIIIAEQLIKFGCYLSFGQELFNKHSKVPKVFNKIPINRIFLETDDADISIQEVYVKAAELKAIEIEELSNQIISNFNICFIKNNF